METIIKIIIEIVGNFEKARWRRTYVLHILKYASHPEPSSVLFLGAPHSLLSTSKSYYLLSFYLLIK